MNGMLNIMSIDDDMAWQKAKNHYNWNFARFYNPCPTNKLLPFWYDKITHFTLSPLTVSEFKIRKINISADSYTVETNWAINTNRITWNRGLNDTFLYKAQIKETLTDATTGVYQFYIKLSDNNEYISEPFWLLFTKQYSVAAGDFNLTDFNLSEFYV